MNNLGGIAKEFIMKKYDFAVVKKKKKKERRKYERKRSIQFYARVKSILTRLTV